MMRKSLLTRIKIESDISNGQTRCPSHISAPHPITIIWRLSTDKVPCVSFGIQLGYFEAPMQPKTKENHFEKTGLSPGSWLADHGPGCRHSVPPDILKTPSTWLQPSNSHSLQADPWFQGPNRRHFDLQPWRFWKGPILSSSSLLAAFHEQSHWHRTCWILMSAPQEIPKGPYILLQPLQPWSGTSQPPQRPHGKYPSAPSEPGLQISIMIVKSETVPGLGSRSSQL